MEFIDLKKQYLEIKEEINFSIQEVLNSTNFILGDKVEELELILKQYVGVSHCISVANGTDALEISLRALNLLSNDEVIMPSFTWVSTAETVAYLGGNPIFADVDSSTFTITPETSKSLINQSTKAIIPVSIFGQMPDLFAFKELCKKNNLYLIEDAAQSFGASLRNAKSCSIADISTTSFFPSKPLGCYGDGGAIFTNNDDLAAEMKLIARHGQKSKNEFIRIGRNSRLDTIQAAILIEKMKIFDSELLLRQKYAELYREMIDIEEVKHPEIQQDATSAYAIYTLRVPDYLRDSLSNFLSINNIPNVKYYTEPLYRQNIYRNSNFTILPNTESLAGSCLSIPMHPYLEREDLEITSNVIKKFFKEAKYAP